MSATEANAEIFVTALRALKRRDRDAIFAKILGDAKLAEDLADSLALEKERGTSHRSFRKVLKELKIAV